MARYRSLFLVLSISFIIAGCIDSGVLGESAEDRYERLLELDQDSTYYVSYDMDTGSSTYMDDTKMTMEIYQYEGTYKTTTSMAYLGETLTLSQFERNNHSIICFEDGLYYDSGGPVCELTDPGYGYDYHTAYMDRVEENFSIEHIGERTIVERACDLFRISVPADELDTAQRISGSNITSSICLDTEKGYMASVTVNVTTDTDPGETATTLMSIEAVEYSGDVTVEDVSLPVPALAEATCRVTYELSYILFQDEDQITVAVNDENRTVDAGTAFERHSLDLSEDTLEAGTNTITLYTEGGSISTECTYRDRLDTTHETSDVDLGEYTLVENRIRNGGFEDAEMIGDEEIIIKHWDHTNGDTNYLQVVEDGIDGQSLRTGWRSNSISPDPVSISQDVDLTDIAAIGIDVEGMGSTPYRSQIVLEIDGERKGTFIRAPQQEEVYEDLGVELSDDYTDTHTVTIRWEHISGDNLGGPAIDNVRAYR